TPCRRTWENAKQSAPLLHELHAQRLLLVTDRLHMPRASGVFERFGFLVGRASVPVYAGHADNVSMLLAGLREYVALIYYKWKGWIGSAPVNPGASLLQSQEAVASAP